MVVVAGLALLGAAPRAEARLDCSFSGSPQNLLAVTSTGLGTHAEIRRSGDRIVVREFLGRRRTCSGGTPTVFNTDTISVLMRGDPGVDLRLDGGPLAPGATPEPEGESEIEIAFRGRIVSPGVTGTAGADEFQWGPGGSYPGLNVNPGHANDRDVDVTLEGKYSFMVAAGAGGNDKIIPAPGFAGLAEGVFSEGGKGNDLLLAPAHAGGILDGGPGVDRLIGGPSRDYPIGGPGDDLLRGGGGDDLIEAGRGADLIFGGLGRDHIKTGQDFRRDVARCGPGRDYVRAKRQDRVRGCESVSH
jgi:RTX calcium-binding nonapeptide repeat (4 copies)